MIVRLNGSLAVFLCFVLSGTQTFPQEDATSATASQPVATSQPATHQAARPPYQFSQLRASQLQGDQRILHALNRFTFGPRPGDLEAVRAMGLDRWFDAQLHPERLDRSDLDARLAQFPAMQWSPEDLLLRLPSNAVIRQAMNGKAAIPAYGAPHAIYENGISRAQAKKQEQERKNEFDAKKPELASAYAGAPTPATERTMMAMGATVSGETGSGERGNGEAGTMAGGEVQANAAQADNPQAGPQVNPLVKRVAGNDATAGQMAASAAESAPTQPAFDETQIARILALPPKQRVARLVAMKQPEFDSFRTALKPPQRAALVADLAPGLREVVAALENPQNLVTGELTAQRLTRDIYSKAQLQEVMTDFWLNHFNVYLHKNDETPYYLVAYERDVIRPLALGKFEDLLEATAHSPAMLLYLDNSSSVGPDSPAADRARIAAARRPGVQRSAALGLNENYARELMELHTLGVNGGYTQADVTQVARVFTGWTIDRPQLGGGFNFDESRHEPGAKRVLGAKIKENGEREGREVLHLLATRPATARFISRKLAIRFVGDEPPRSLVDRMAKSYLSSGGDIAAVLTTLFHSPEFWDSGAYRAKVKTPLEFVVSAMRATDADTQNQQPLANALREMGMPLYGSVPPTGYNWQASTWVSAGALVNRMNFALSLAANRLPGIAIAWTTQQAEDSIGNAAPSLIPSPPPGPMPSPQAEEARLESILVAGGTSDSTRAAVLDQFQAQIQPAAQPLTPAAKPLNPAKAAAQLEKQDQLLAGLLLGSPEFQRR
jgi:uncharacterized protein (DUF1800 family)